MRPDDDRLMNTMSPEQRARQELLKTLKGLLSVYLATRDHIPGHHGDDCWACKAWTLLERAGHAARGVCIHCGKPTP